MAQIRLVPGHRYAAAIDLPSFVPLAAVADAITNNLGPLGFEEIKNVEEKPHPSLPDGDTYITARYTGKEERESPPLPERAVGVVDLDATSTVPATPPKPPPPGLQKEKEEAMTTTQKIALAVVGTVVAAGGLFAAWMWWTRRKKRNPAKKKRQENPASFAETKREWQREMEAAGNREGRANAIEAAKQATAEVRERAKELKKSIAAECESERRKARAKIAADCAVERRKVAVAARQAKAEIERTKKRDVRTYTSTPQQTKQTKRDAFRKDRELEASVLAGWSPAARRMWSAGRGKMLKQKPKRLAIEEYMEEWLATEREAGGELAALEAADAEKAWRKKQADRERAERAAARRTKERAA